MSTELHKNDNNYKNDKNRLLRKRTLQGWVLHDQAALEARVINRGTLAFTACGSAWCGSFSAHQSSPHRFDVDRTALAVAFDFAPPG